MAFTRVRTIKGKRYLYKEERWREGKRVRSKSSYLGPVGAALNALGGFIAVNLKREGYSYSLSDADLARHNELVAAREAEQQAFLDELHEAYGLKVGPSDPVPVEKGAPAVSGEGDTKAGGGDATPASSGTGPR